MEPIVSPVVVYALRVFDKLYFACGMVLMCCVTVAPLLALFGNMEESECMMKYAKILAIVAAICALALIIVPNKDALIAMMATSYITPDNIQALQGNVVEFIRQISEAMQNGK